MRKGRTQRTRCRASRATLQLLSLEDRVLLNGISLVSNWNNGTTRYADGWAEDRGNRKIAYMGHYGNNAGIYIFDITNPANPVHISTFQKSFVSQFQDVETVKIGNRWIGLFSSDDSDGLFIVDVTVPENPVELYNIKSQHGGTNNVHTLSVWRNYVFEADSRTDTVRIFNISVPENPVWVRNIVSQTGHDVHEVTVVNGRMYTANIWGGGSAEVWDVRRLARAGAPVQFLGVMFPGSMAHTSWPSDDGNYLAVAREAQGGDLSFWDIHNPGSPVKLWSLSVPSTEAWCVHQVVIKGNLLYLSWYQNGVSVFDISNPSQPALVGSYDTYLGSINTRFPYQGAWGVFPFPGDVTQLLAFDLQSGMYILKIDENPPAPLPKLRQVAPGEYVLDSSSSNKPTSYPALRDVPPGDSVELVGGVLRVVVGDVGRDISISRLAASQSIGVTVDGTTQYTFPADKVVQINFYGGAGDDSIVLDPSLKLPIYADGGAGYNTATGWPTHFATGNQHQTRKVNGAFVHGLKGDPALAERFQVVEPAGSSLVMAHGLHAGSIGAAYSGGHSVMTGELSEKQSGVPAHAMFAGGGTMSAAMGAGHAGGTISPELMQRVSLNNQVGGQVAYHKPG